MVDKSIEQPTVRSGLKIAVLAAAGGVLLMGLLIGSIGLLERINLWPVSVYNFRLEAEFVFDGQPYTAVGSMQCRYRRAWFTLGSSPHRIGGPIYQGYYTSTMRDSPSVLLGNGKGAIVFQHGGSCPPLPVLQETYAVEPTVTKGSWPAFYLPDRNNPKVVWVMRDARPPHDDTGRFLLLRYAVVPTTQAQPTPLAQNVPAVWRWYEQMSAQHRTGQFDQRTEDAWFGLVACVLPEEEWRKSSDYVRAAEGLSEVTVMTLSEPGRNWARNCPLQHLSQISLIPSEDYSKATLDLDRLDLRWTAITTPYAPEHRDPNIKRWAPELCVTGDGCTGIRPRPAYWVYVPSRRVFARVDTASFETFRFPNFALRHGDGL
jgi:hypothetical protein